LNARRVQIASMKTSVLLDDDLAGEVEKTSSLVGESQATILRMAIRAGLRVVASAFQPPQPEGYFADAYRRPDPEREKLEEAMLKVPQKPER
jgi:hypothetical protein